jgi:hypothetical protein
MTPREIDLALAGAADRDLQLARVAQGIAYSVAVLMGKAYHEPRRFPAFDKAFPDPRKARAGGGEQTAQEALQNMQAWTAAIAAFRTQKPSRIRVKE